MSASFTNQVIAQLELWENENYKNEVYVLPKHLDEKVAALHLEKLGVKLTQLSTEQAEYLGLDRAGPTSPTLPILMPRIHWGRVVGAIGHMACPR